MGIKTAGITIGTIALFAACGDPAEPQYGEACTGNCAGEGMCVDLGNESVCSTKCNSANPCPNGDLCVNAGALQVCQPGEKPPEKQSGFGGTCKSSFDCSGEGTCFVFGDKGYCTKDCTGDFYTVCT